VENAEPEEAGTSARGWRLRFTQIAPGACSGSVREAEFPSLRVVTACFSAEVAVHSRPLAEEDDPLQVGVISPGRERVLWDGHRVSRDRLLLKEGSQGSNFRVPAGCELLVARVDRPRLEALSTVVGAPPDKPSHRLVQLYRVPREWLGTLRSQIDTLARAPSSGLGGLAEEVERDFYEQLALALACPRESMPPSPETRRRVLRRAEEYMWAHCHERISLPDLCAAADCSERTLRYAFHERYGLSPTALLKRVRLQGLRSHLQNASPRERILDAALRWGFWHLGHLGRDYRALFGETPAATLAGTSCDPMEHGPLGAA
jgi:AraC family ethanolamine operon transcriptional activator